MYRKLQTLRDLGIPFTSIVTNPSLASMLMYMRKATMPDPWYIQIEPARKCNLHCPHCVQISGTGMLSFDTFKRIVDGNRNLRYVKLQGLGEPLLNPDLALMAMHAKGRGCRTEVISNGTIKPSVMLMDSIDYYVVSMETCDPELYKAIRGVDIDRVIGTLDLLKHAFKGKIGINCVLTDDTDEDDVVALKEFAKDYGATVTTPFMQNWLSPGQPGYEVMQEKVMWALWVHEREMGVADVNQERFCQWAFNQAYYDYHGRLHPCCIRMSDCYDLGKSWNGVQMQTFRKERKGHSFCKNCPL